MSRSKKNARNRRSTPQTTQMIDTPNETPPSKERAINRPHPANVLGGALVLCAAIVIGFMLSDRANADQLQEMQANQTEQQRQIEELTADHVHEWETVYKTIRHEATTDTVHHPAEYGMQTIYHTVCTTCGEKVDNAVDMHEDATGHKGYSTDVPFEESALIKEAYDETVVVSDAWTEEAYDRSICKRCGETSVLMSNDESA